MMRSDQTIVYLCYGRDDIYDQAIFSLLSLLHVGGTDGLPSRVVVYCDRPEAFAGLPVEAVLLDATALELWLGGSDYVHQRKICAIVDALECFGGAIMFVDTDTYFRRSPMPLLDWIAPGRTCFHICEGFVRSTGMPADSALARPLAAGDYHLASGEAVVFGRLTPMWNTGVVGVHAADTARVLEALALADVIWARADPAGAYGKKIHHAEQFAMGYAFRRARLREASPYVFHYWPLDTKAVIGAALPELVHSGLADRSRWNLERIYGERPRETGIGAIRSRLKMAVRRTALAIGVPVEGVRRSV